MSAHALHPIAEAMPEAQFWQIVEASLQAAQASGADADDPDALQEAQRDALTDSLRRAGWQDILRFKNRFDQLHVAAYRNDLWCAAYIMNGGCSDDGFIDFRAWLISRGQALYTQALANPDEALAAVADPACDYYEFEDFTYGLMDAFADLTDGADFYEYLAGDATEPELTGPDWEDDEGDSMRAICPRLYAMFFDEG